MPRHPVSDLLLHNFPENGVKFLLHNPGNFRDVMAYLAARYRTLPDLGCFHFARRTIEPDTLIRVFFEQAVTMAIGSRQFAGSPPPAAHPIQPLGGMSTPLFRQGVRNRDRKDVRLPET